MKRLLVLVMLTVMATAGFAKSVPEIPQSSIDLLLKDPNSSMIRVFDERYGEGAAKKILDASGIDTRTDAEKQRSKRIQTANEVIPRGKFISTIAQDGFVIVHNGAVYQCRAYKLNEIGCSKNPDK